MIRAALAGATAPFRTAIPSKSDVDDNRSIRPAAGPPHRSAGRSSPMIPVRGNLA